MKEEGDVAEGFIMEVLVMQDQHRSMTKREGVLICGLIAMERRHRSGLAVAVLLVHERNIRVQRVEWKIGAKGQEMKLGPVLVAILIGEVRIMELQRLERSGVSD